MKTKELLGIKHPIIQAPMAGVQDSELTLAVCAAGGLGSLPCAMLSPKSIHNELTRIRQHTDKPFNLNFFCHSQPAPNTEKEVAWRQTLKPYYDEFGIDSNTIPNVASRMPFSHDIADVIEPFQPKIISFHFGLPAKDLLQRVKGWGATILSSATTIEEALWLESNGCDAIIAQGIEAGGHRGMFLSQDLSTQQSTFKLLEEVIASVQIPVIAAGGIADKNALTQALKSGAIAAQIGTAFLLCPEAKTSLIHREKLKSNDAKQTAVTNVFTGKPARSIINRAIEEFGPINPDTPDFPLAVTGIAPLRSAAESNGSADFTPLWAGQNASRCKEISAGNLIEELVSGTRHRPR